MSIFMSGLLSSVRIDLNPSGAVSVIGGGRSAMTYDPLHADNRGLTDIEQLMGGVQVSYDEDLAHLNVMPANWVLAATSDGGRLQLSSPLRSLMSDAPQQAHVSVSLLTDSGSEQKAQTVFGIVVPQATFDIFLDLFKAVLGIGEARYQIHVGPFMSFEDGLRQPDAAVTAKDFMEGKRLLLSPAEVSFQVRPPRRQRSRPSAG